MNSFCSKGFVPLERALSKLGICSRTKAHAFVLEGRITVNGNKVVDPLFPVIPEKDRLELDGRIIKKSPSLTILLHKPKGYVTTRLDEKGRKTVYDLLPPHLHHLHPVGRLDLHTSGLLLLTTDTRLSSYLTDPYHEIPRVYLVLVRGRVSEGDRQKLIQGIEDLGQQLQASDAVLCKVSGKETLVKVTLTEGKNREIRRLFAAISHEVLSLKRISFGQWELGSLELGKWKELIIENKSVV